jgi:hypothetical protein
MGVDVVVVVVVHGGVEGKQGQEERRQKAEQTRTVILQDMSRSRLGRYMVLGSRTDQQSCPGVFPKSPDPFRRCD